MEEDLNEGEELGKPTKDLTYPSFLGRAGAYILDSLILAPVWILFYFLTRKLYTSESMLYPSAIITAIFSFLLIFYKIFFNTKFNGTPGKILCKYRICREDGMPVTWETSIKRESLYIVFQLFNFLVLYKFIFAHRAEIDTFWLLVSLFAKSAEAKMCIWAGRLIWIFDHGKALFSPKRITLHDKIAGTVVVYRL